MKSPCLAAQKSFKNTQKTEKHFLKLCCKIGVKLKFKNKNSVCSRVENAVVKCKYVFINSIQNIPPTTMSIERGIWWSAQCPIL